ncbi:hypothetical protein RB195_004503 [Necator americanus]|uniref:Uncharacterized protein n=1 Tax=Necator americanus TaxID=51031 RepID=A0ABR1BK43_NECAM
MMNDLTPELDRRRRAPWGAYKSIEGVVKKTRNTRFRAHLFNTTVLPALTYASKAGHFASRKKTRRVRRNYVIYEKADAEAETKVEEEDKAEGKDKAEEKEKVEEKEKPGEKKAEEKKPKRRKKPKKKEKAKEKENAVEKEKVEGKDKAKAV